MGNPNNEELKIGDIVLIKNQTQQSPFDARYKPSYRIIKRNDVKSSDVQGPAGKVKRVSAWYLQFMYLAEYYVTALPQMEMFRKTAEVIKHPGLLPNLYKDLDDDRHTVLDKQTVLTKSTRHVPWVIHIQHLTVTICDPMIEMCM